MREIKSLTGLRGYAALWVCLHHYHYGDYSGELSYYLKLAKQGSWGVIIFFVLSGFIIAYVYQGWFRQGWSWYEFRQFLIIRLARVYPLHLLTLLLWAFFCAIGFIGYNNNDTLYTFILNLFLIHAWGFTDVLSWNQPSWSISMELFAYATFPGWLLLARGLDRYWILIALCAVLLAIAYPPHPRLLRWTFSIFGEKLVIHQFDYGLSMLTWSLNFGFGVLVFHCTRQLMINALQANMAFVCGVSGVFVVIYLFPDIGAGIISAAISLFAGLIILGGFYSSKLGEVLMGNRFGVFLGNISYGLYLTHIMTPLVLDKLLICLGQGWTFTGLPIPIRVATALVVAAFVFERFEKPCRLWFRDRWVTT